MSVCLPRTYYRRRNLVFNCETRLSLVGAAAMQKFDITNKRVWVAGHRAMVGTAIVRRLARENVCLQTVERSVLDLRYQSAVAAWVESHRPQVVILAVAKVGGILANANYPADFLEDNLVIELAVIGA